MKDRRTVQELLSNYNLNEGKISKPFKIIDDIYAMQVIRDDLKRAKLPPPKKILLLSYMDHRNLLTIRAALTQKYNMEEVGETDDKVELEYNCEISTKVTSHGASLWGTLTIKNLKAIYNGDGSYDLTP